MATGKRNNKKPLRLYKSRRKQVKLRKVTKKEKRYTGRRKER